MHSAQPPTLTLRLATSLDLGAVDALLARCYPRLLAADYAPSVRVTALPIIARAQPLLLASGRYWLALGDDGRLLGAGGWSLGAPRATGPGPRSPLTAHVRHVATDPDALRRGVGRTILMRCIDGARAAGAQRMECLSTRMAVPFYAALGFRGAEEVTVPLAPGIAFPAVRMGRDL